MRLLRYLAFPLLVAGTAALTVGQGPGVPVPDYIIYDAFFSRVMWLDGVGAQISAKGRDGSAASGTIRKQAGLTLAEEAHLKTIAASWRERTAALAAEARALSQSSQSTDMAALQQFSGRHAQMTRDLVEDLKSRLGPQRFARLDGYIRITTRVRPPASLREQKGAGK